MMIGNSFRRIAVPIAVLGLGLLLSGCIQERRAKGSTTPALGSEQLVDAQSADGYKIGDPYQVDGRWYYPKVDYHYRETGIASWYGPGFHGNRTANGEIYDQNTLTAAHRTLPLPSMVQVTNLENGRSIKVRINDRGPFSNGRIIDLSRRAADLLGFRQRGTAKVRVEIVEHESRALATLALSEEAAETAPDPAPIIPVAVKDLTAVEEAANTAPEPAGALAAEAPGAPEATDTPPAVIAATDDVAPETDNGTAVTPVNGTAVTPVNGTPREPEPPTQAAHLAISPQPAGKPNPAFEPIPAAEPIPAVEPTATLQSARLPQEAPAPDGVVTKVPVRTTRIYVQAGSFTRIHNAHKLRAKLVNVGKAKIKQALVDNRRFFRVRFGPMGSVEDADKLLALLIDNGHEDARVVVE